MTDEDRERPSTADPIVGRPLDEAVERVVAREDASDPDAVREALSYVTEDGVVTPGAVDDALGELSKVVSTPESRAEFAGIELSNAREAAEGVADLATVRSRLDSLESRLDAVESWVDELGAELRGVLDTAAESDDLYRVAVGIRELTATATAAQRAADEIYVDAQELQEWLATWEVRADELDDDVDGLADTLDRLEGVADDVADAAADAEAGDAPEGVDVAVAWADATLRHRVVDLLFADLRADVEAFRAWNDRVDIDDGGRLDAVDGRLDDLRDRWRETGDRLDDLARPAWRERFGDRLSAFDAALGGFEPPVDWGDVQATLDEYRPDADGSEEES
jgi:hypothetical protein